MPEPRLKTVLRTLAAGAMLAYAPVAMAQKTGTAAPGNPPNTPPGPALEGNANPQLSQPDRAFLSKDAQGAAYERELAVLASTKASDPRIKQYAQTVARDHTDYNGALQTVGEDNGLPLPNAPDAKQAARLKQFQAMSGPAFDTGFLQEMREINQADAADAKAEADSTMNAGIRNFIVKFRQMDEKHLKDAQDLSG